MLPAGWSIVARSRQCLIAGKGKRSGPPTCRVGGVAAAAASSAARPTWRSAALGVALALLVLAAAPQAARAAIRYDPDSDAEGGSLMTPTRGELLNRRFYYEIPHDPVGVLFMGEHAAAVRHWMRRIELLCRAVARQAGVQPSCELRCIVCHLLMSIYCLPLVCARPPCCA